MKKTFSISCFSATVPHNLANIAFFLRYVPFVSIPANCIFDLMNWNFYKRFTNFDLRNRAHNRRAETCQCWQICQLVRRCSFTKLNWSWFHTLMRNTCNLLWWCTYGFNNTMWIVIIRIPTKLQSSHDYCMWRLCFE